MVRLPPNEWGADANRAEGARQKSGFAGEAAKGLVLTLAPAPPIVAG